MRIVFMGTPDFAVPSLDALIKEGYEVAAVVTQPDKPKGRGNKMTAPPVKEYAQKAGIKVLQPEKVKTQEFINNLKDITPDLLVTAAYGKILPKGVLDIPALGCINVHGSLLPKYRGAAPIHWAIINGETTTGITTMFTDIGMDTGDILLKDEIKIDENMTTCQLHDEMSMLGAKTLIKTLKALEDGTLKRIPQSDDEATYAPIIQKEIGLIDWNKPAKEIHNLVRGTYPWPGAYTFYKGERMRIWEITPVKGEPVNCKPGYVYKVDKDGITVACSLGNVQIKEVQFDSCRRMAVEQYICGHEIDEGEVLG